MNEWYFFVVIMALSPLDDRYQPSMVDLEEICSEFGLMKGRVKVEIVWLRRLKNLKIAPAWPQSVEKTLQKLEKSITRADHQAIKKIENTVKHDVKAVEYWLRTKLPKDLWPFLHLSCTSEDINNLAYGLMLKQARELIAIQWQKVLFTLKNKALHWSSVPMLARTHGQSATPTTMGKEMAVFVSRWQESYQSWLDLPIKGKFNGATGTYAAHLVASRDIGWPEVAQEMVESLGLVWNPITTQIEAHDYQARYAHELSLGSSIGIDLSRDAWGYISLGYWGQETVVGEVGSSTMPHKVNPINFENSEGNFKLTRGLCRTLADELPVSRWQRDLTDSTLQRNWGVALGHFYLALLSLETGLHKIKLCESKLNAELTGHAEVLAEAIQTALRVNGDADAYEKIKTMTRGKTEIVLADLHDFIASSDLPTETKKYLTALRPESYIGLSADLAKMK